ncbi:MAG: hypothetical protein OQJ89_12145 [Kangiellaceae bacterium]|nr:hypothetical protein [Kangiellaceae bacterium]MCW8997163.1 hypothetical protein [Kangiellaceae bacterium]MCW9017711.1 hypothetical protein [Kangiellaceae bacterium]
MKYIYLILVTLLFLAPSLTEAKSKNVKHVNEKHYSLSIEGKKIKLTKLLDSVSERTDKNFLLHANSRAEVVAYGVDLDKVSYADLLTIIDLNGMAVIDIDGVVNIVPVKSIKQYPIPSIQDGDKVEHGSLWVSKVIDAGNNNVNQLLPILRALVRYNGHMATHQQSNSLVLVAPYNSVMRIEKIIKELEQATSKKSKEKA